jgi:hypothetical protein
VAVGVSRPGFEAVPGLEPPAPGSMPALLGVLSTRTSAGLLPLLPAVTGCRSAECLLAPSLGGPKFSLSIE